MIAEKGTSLSVGCDSEVISGLDKKQVSLQSLRKGKNSDSAVNGERRMEPLVLDMGTKES